VGAWTVSDVRDGWREGARYEPRMGEDERATLLAGWTQALERARSR
jgi:glycerol kinase